MVTLDVSDWYRGGPPTRSPSSAPPTDMQALVAGGDFQAGQRYLVSANDGFVTVCGFTAPYSDDLAALYAEAFGALAWPGDRRRTPPRRRRRHPDGPAQGPRRRRRRDALAGRALGRLHDGGCRHVTVVLGAAADEAATLVDRAPTCTWWWPPTGPRG